MGCHCSVRCSTSVPAVHYKSSLRSGLSASIRQPFGCGNISQQIKLRNPIKFRSFYRLFKCFCKQSKRNQQNSNNCNCIYNLSSIAINCNTIFVATYFCHFWVLHYITHKIFLLLIILHIKPGVLSCLFSSPYNIPFPNKEMTSATYYPMNRRVNCNSISFINFKSPIRFILFHKIHM